MSSTMRWMIVDGRGGAEVRYRESRQDRRPPVFRQGRLRRSPMSQRVKCVHVYTCGRRRVCESSLFPSARSREDLLQLKRVKCVRCARCSVCYVHVLVERPGCGQQGSVRCRRRTVVGKATVKRGGVCAVGGEATVRKYKRSMVRTECEDRNSAGTYVRTECGRPINGGGKA